MATIEIRGTQCQFKGIPLSTLQQYGPLPSTHVIAWRAEDQVIDIFIHSFLRCLEYVKAIDRLSQFMLEHPQGNFPAALFDYEAGTTRLLSDLDNYLRIFCPRWHYLACPWRIAKHEDAKDDLNDLYGMDKALLAIYEASARRHMPIPREAINKAVDSANLYTIYGHRLAATDGAHLGTPAAREGAEHLLKYLQQHEQ